MKLKVIRSGGAWYVVSTIYEPPSLGSVDSGTIWAEPHSTRKLARAAMKAVQERYWGKP